MIQGGDLMQRDGIVINGQVNIFKDNAMGTVTQTNHYGNPIDVDEVIEAIKRELVVFDEDIRKEHNDTLDMIQEELSNPAPRKERLVKGIKLLAPLVAIANGIPTLVENVDKLLAYLSGYLH